MPARQAGLVEGSHGQFADTQGQLVGERLQSCCAACEILLGARVRL